MDALRLSHSYIQEYQTCLRKSKIYRLDRIRPKKKPSYFIQGNLIHAGIEAWMMGLSVDNAIKNVLTEINTKSMNKEEIKGLQIMKTITVGILDAYRIHYGADRERFRTIQTEKTIDVVINKDPRVTHRSIIDMMAQDRSGAWWIYDHKTTGQINDNYLQQAALSNQTLGYLHAARRFLGEWPKGIVYNIILKPSIRPRTKRNPETLDQFCSRLYQEYANNPDKYFFREDILTNKRMVKAWLDETTVIAGEIVARIKMTEEIGDTAWPKCTGACFNYNSTCQYMPICSSGKVNKMLYERVP